MMGLGLVVYVGEASDLPPPPDIPLCASSKRADGHGSADLDPLFVLGRRTPANGQ